MNSGMFLLLATLMVATVTLASDKYTDQEARKILSDNGITVNKPHPTTSLEGIRKNTIDQLLTLKSASGCDIMVTGGTESGQGHTERGTKNHGAGYKLDLKLATCINNYIQNSFTSIGRRSGDNAEMYKSGAGNIYALEGNHWDILFV